MTTRFSAPFGAVLTACLGLAAPLAAAPRVAVDIAPVHSLVARVMEGVAEPALIVPPTATPHAYSLRPSEAAALDRADVVIWMGAGLTPWLAGAIDTLAGDAHRITLLAAGASTVLEFREGLAFAASDAEEGGHGHEDHDDHGHDGHDHDHAEQAHGHDDHAQDKDARDARTEAEHDHGDDHGDDHAHAHEGADPHAWLDPANARVWLGMIAAELAGHDPENAARYEANATAAAEELVALEARIEAQLAPVRDIPYVVQHDAYQYFEARFGVAPTGALSPGDAADPGPARVAALRDLAREQGIVCVFGEPQFAGARISAIFGDTVGHSVLDPLGSGHTPGPGLYPALLTDMADALVDCLGGQG